MEVPLDTALARKQTPPDRTFRRLVEALLADTISTFGKSLSTPYQQASTDRRKERSTGEKLGTPKICGYQKRLSFEVLTGAHGRGSGVASNTHESSWIIRSCLLWTAQQFFPATLQLFRREDQYERGTQADTDFMQRCWEK